VVLLREIDGIQGALNVAEKIRVALNVPFLIEGHDIEIGCSVGVAIYPDHGQNEIELSKHADAAMYRAKQDGRSTIRLAEPG
jgi:diguanylate cyclase (GGDEF)-like protein